MDQDQLVDELFEFALLMHGFMIGVLMRGGASSKMALAEVEPLREKLVGLYEAAGRAVPSCLDREQSQ